MTKFIPHRNLLLGTNLVGLLIILLLILVQRLSGREVRTFDQNLARHPLTLHDCIAIALGESPKLEATRLDLLAAGEEIRAAQALLWPNLTGSATGEAFSGDRTSKFGIVNAGTTGAGISTNKHVSLAGVGIFGLKLEYPVFKDGSIFGFNDAPAVELKTAERNALGWTAHRTSEAVFYRFTQVFVDTVSAENRIEPTDHRVTLLDRSVDIHKEEQQKGLLLPIDVEVVTRQLDSARSLSKTLHEQATAGYLGLARLLGLSSSAHIRLNNTLTEPPAPPDAAELSHTLLARHPSLRVQLAIVNKAKQDYRLENFRLYPSVTLHGSAVDVSDFSTDAHLFVGGVTVDIPIFDFVTQLDTVRARRDTYHAEQARLGAVGNDLASDLVRIYREIYALSERILTLQVEAGKLDRELRDAQAQQQQGITPPSTALDAELTVIG